MGEGLIGALGGPRGTLHSNNQVSLTLAWLLPALISSDAQVHSLCVDCSWGKETEKAALG
jgi:hypothetical protein